MKKLTEKHLNELAMLAAFADIKNDEENIVPLYVIRETPSNVQIPKMELVRI